jgi:ribosomal protein L17
MAWLMRNYNSKSAQKLNQIKSNLANAQTAMSQNLSMALTRGEQLTTMEGKAEDIRSSAQTFRREAEKLDVSNAAKSGSGTFSVPQFCSSSSSSLC